MLKSNFNSWKNNIKTYLIIKWHRNCKININQLFLSYKLWHDSCFGAKTPPHQKKQQKQKVVLYLLLLLLAHWLGYAGHHFVRVENHPESHHHCRKRKYEYKDLYKNMATTIKKNIYKTLLHSIFFFLKTNFNVKKNVKVLRWSIFFL